LTAPARAEAGITREDMSMAATRASLGRPPDDQRRMTCGQSAPRSWPCQIWVYTGDASELAIYFRRDAGEWRVNSWRVRYRK
jgi:hypothetical protein